MQATQHNEVLQSLYINAKQASPSSANKKISLFNAYLKHIEWIIETNDKRMEVLNDGSIGLNKVDLSICLGMLEELTNGLKKILTDNHTIKYNR